MSKKTKTPQTEEELIAQVQQELMNIINATANMCISFDAGIISKLKKQPNQYPDSLVMDATLIFYHVISNVGILKGNINEKNINDVTNVLHELTLKTTGVNTKTFYKEKNNGK